MIATYSIPVAGCKRLIAMGVAADPVVKKALKNGRVMVAGGTTCSYVAEQLAGLDLPEKWRYTVGVVTPGTLGITDEKERVAPVCLKNGEVVGTPWLDFLAELEGGDVIIKGGNAVDHEGNVGVLLGGDRGGTMGNIMGIVWARGVHLVMPVGNEKMIPSVREAAKYLGIGRADTSGGLKVGMAVIAGAHIVNEKTALENLFQVKAVIAGSGGNDGAEGSTMLAVEGEPAEVLRACELLERLRFESSIRGIITGEAQQ